VSLNIWEIQTCANPEKKKLYKKGKLTAARGHVGNFQSIQALKLTEVTVIWDSKQTPEV